MWPSLQEQSFFRVQPLGGTSWDFQKWTGEDSGDRVLSALTCVIQWFMYPPLECVFSSYITSWTEKFPRVTVFCVNRACLSLTCLFQVQSGPLSWLLQDWVLVLSPVPSSLGLWPASVFILQHDEATSSLSSDFSLSIPFIIFDVWDSHRNQNSFKNVPFMVSKKTKLIPIWLI